MYPNVSGERQGQMLMVAPVTKSAIPRFLQVQDGQQHTHSAAVGRVVQFPDSRACRYAS